MFFVLFFSQLGATLAAQPADLRNGPLSFDLAEARKFLEARAKAPTSAWFSNPENYDIGLGHAHAGVRWGNYSVNFSSSSAIELTTISRENSRRAGDKFVSVQGLRWDQEKNKYVGRGTYYGRGSHHCPLNAMAADIEIEVFRNHPFQGAWSSMTINYQANFVDSNSCRVLYMVPTTKYAHRSLTAVETIRAMEQASFVWNTYVGEFRDFWRNQQSLARQARALDDTTDAEKQEIDRFIEQIDQNLKLVDRLETMMSDTLSRLKFGGRMRDFYTQEFIEFEKPVPLEKVPSKLLQFTGQAMVDALGIKKFVMEKAK